MINITKTSNQAKVGEREKLSINSLFGFEQFSFSHKEIPLEVEKNMNEKGI
jgi:hypothetical protein